LQPVNLSTTTTTLARTATVPVRLVGGGISLSVIISILAVLIAGGALVVAFLQMRHARPKLSIEATFDVQVPSGLRVVSWRVRNTGGAAVRITAVGFLLPVGSVPEDRRNVWPTTFAPGSQPLPYRLEAHDEGLFMVERSSFRDVLSTITLPADLTPIARSVLGMLTGPPIRFERPD
jgi:hypothetical protein